VLELEKRGLRERVVKKRDAPMKSFATGEFELILEPIPGREGEAAASLLTAAPVAKTEKVVQIGGRKTAPSQDFEEEGRIPPSLEICRACNCFVWPEEETCPHCGADLAAVAEAHEVDVQRRQALIAEVEELIRKAQEGQAGRKPVSMTV
jgi:hypothetical protein